MPAELCPVCQGSGKYYIPLSSGNTAAIGTYLTCHGCYGKWWVETPFPPKWPIKEKTHEEGKENDK